MKFAGNTKLSTFTKTTLILPSEYLIDQSTSCKVTVVERVAPTPRRLNTDRGIRLMLAPKSQSALPTLTPPIEQGMVKLLGSLSLVGKTFVTTVVHSCDIASISNSLRFFLLERMSLRNLAYLGICANASTKGMLLWSWCRMSKNYLNWVSSAFFCSRLGKGASLIVVVGQRIAGQ